MSFLSKNLILNFTSDFWPSDVLDIIKKYLLSSPRIIAAIGKSIKVWSPGVITTKTIGDIWSDAAVTAVSLSPNGKYIASGDDFGYVNIWDSITGNCVNNRMKFQTRVKCLAWCPKSTYIASCSENRVFILHSLEATIFQSILAYSVQWAIYYPAKHNVHSISWSPNGEHIVTSNLEECVKIFNVKTGICEKTFSHNLDLAPIDIFWKEPESFVKKNVEWSSNYTKIASSNNGMNGGNILIWDTISGECVKILEHPSRLSIRSFSWSPNGTHIVSCCSTKIFIWNTVSGICEMILSNYHQLYSYVPLDDQIHSVVWSSDGKHIVSCTVKKIEVWDALSGELLHIIPKPKSYEYRCQFDIHTISVE